MKPIGTQCVDSIVSLDPNRKVGVSIFDVQLSTTWIDEAHTFRGIANPFFCAFQLRQNASMVNCLTATPIWTAPRVS